MEEVGTIEASLRKIKGIDAVFLLEEQDRLRLLDVETAAEKKAFMGLGKCYNSGMRDVLRCPVVFVCITTMDFEWGRQSLLILKKDDEIVGEQVQDRDKIKRLEMRKDVWFLHKNFVIYKDKVAFPRDLVDKKCCFEIPALTSEDSLPGVRDAGDCLLCFPSTAGDVFLKRTYYEAKDERGTGTVLFGFNLRK